MATIAASEIVESVDRGTYKRNRYRYTLSNGEIHERRSWIAAAVVNADDLAAVGVRLLDELAQAEIDRELS